MMLLVSIFVIFTTLFYMFLKPYSYWSKRYVQTGKLKTIITDNLGIFLGIEHLSDMVQRVYNEYQDARYIGIYQLREPVLVLKSPELIKEICVKNFDHFQNHKNILSKTVEQLWYKNILILKGDSWRKMRSTITPSFTGSKMRSMFNLICQNADNFVQHFKEKEENIVEVELRNAFTRYTTDVIASIAFGLQVNSLKDRENEYYMMSYKATDSSGFLRKSSFILYQLFPTIANFLRLPFFGNQVTSYFLNLVNDTIQLREQQTIKRSDMLGLLIDASQREIEEDMKSNDMKQDLTVLDIAAQVFVFIVGSFETLSTALCFMAYELAVNQDIQKRLIEEIDENKSPEGAFSYEKIQNMKYMNMVVSELLRKWPVNVATDRVVTKPYTIDAEQPGEKPVHLEKNTIIMIPIFAVHRDPRHYENPEKFDPERFSPENKKNINPYIYFPFGVGPRICIGNRFALLAMKILIFYLLSNFEIVPVKNTQIPIKLSKDTFSITSENGFMVGFKTRF